MFKSMRLKNFKAYKDSCEIPLAPLTVIIGANNTGKSTLFHALLALVQTARDTDHGWAPRLVTKGLVDLNGFHDIVHASGRLRSSNIEISVSLDPNRRINEDSESIGYLRIPDQVELSFGFNEEFNETIVNRSTFRERGIIRTSVEDKNGDWILVSSPNGSDAGLEVDFVKMFPFLAPARGDVSRASKAAMKTYNITNFCATLWADFFARKVSHVGPLRVRVPWYTSVGARTNSPLLGGENLIADLGSNEKDRRTGKSRLELAGDWLAKSKVLSTIHLKTDKANAGRMLLGDDWNGPKNINIAAMGEGVSQILPIIAYALFGMNDDCMLVEQPEIHLHPKLQAELGDLFIDVARTGHRQLLVETHSEHLLLRIRRRIAEGKVDPSQVAILFVEKDGGEAKIHRLDVNSRGHFSDWPEGFFDEAYQDAMALAAAAARKG